MTGDTVEPIVATRAGRVCGAGRADHQVFLGVPYAAPPIGERRMAPPVPAEPWEGVRPAQAYGPTAQRERSGGSPDLIPAPSIPGEDILTVNVFTPAADERAGLPVLVWIHGGAYEEGSPASPWFDGASFARAGVVTVTIGYRLGFAGFGVIPGAQANLGVRDWIAALEWVQQNIAAFGGDPARVTVAGQSAGGGAVLTLLGCARAAGLFRAAWVSSPTLPTRYRAAAEDGTRRLAKHLGVPATRAGLAAVSDGRLHAAQSLLRGRWRLPSIGRMVTELPVFAPVVDGDLLPEPTLTSLHRGTGGTIPLVIGANDDEVPLAAQLAPTLANRVPLDLALRAAGVRPRETRRHYAAALRAEGLVSAPAAVDRSISDRVFRRVVLEVACARATAAAPTYAYRFAWPSPVKGGAIHCLDVPFLWDVLDDPEVPALTGAAPPEELVGHLHGTLLALVHGAAVPWPAWTPGEQQVTCIDMPSTTTRPRGYDSVKYFA